MKKKIAIIIMIILILMIAALSIYKFVFSVENPRFFAWVYAEDDYVASSANSQLDKDTFSDKIITENLLSVDYDYFCDDESITGKVYISSDEYLYITDVNNDLTYRVSTTKFKTMYIKDYEYSDGIYIYLISSDNKLYFMELTGNDITKAIVKEIYTSLKVTNFVDLDFIDDMYEAVNALLVLCDDGNIYDAASGIRYNDKTKILYSNIYVHEDNSMSNIYGKVYKDAKGNTHKIKHIFLTYDDNDFSGKNTILIVTEDNKLLYLDNDFQEIFEFCSDVKDIKFSLNYPYLKGKLYILFEDGYDVNIDASCNEYYCINELEL